MIKDTLNKNPEFIPPTQEEVDAALPILDTLPYTELDRTSITSVKHITLPSGKYVVAKDFSLHSYDFMQQNLLETAFHGAKNEVKMYQAMHDAGIASLPHCYGFYHPTQGRFMVLTEFIPGETLIALPQEKALNNMDALVTNIFQVLHPIHEKGFLWKDLNAGAIRIQPDLSIMMLDPADAINLAEEKAYGLEWKVARFYIDNFSIKFPSRALLASEEIYALDNFHQFFLLEQKLAIGALLARAFGDPKQWHTMVQLNEREIERRQEACIAHGMHIPRHDESEKTMLMLDLYVKELITQNGVSLSPQVEEYIIGIMSPFSDVKEVASQKFQEYMKGEN